MDAMAHTVGAAGALLLLLAGPGCPPRGGGPPRGSRDARRPASPDIGAYPAFEPPPDTEILAQMEKALDRKVRSDLDRFLDAEEPGELLEHATLTQVEVDRSRFGIDALFVIGD